MSGIFPTTPPKMGASAMGRHAGLRQRDGYWISYTGGKATYFGRVADTPHADALRRFHELVGGGGQDNAPPPPTLTVNALADRFLTWVLEHRGRKAHAERSRHLQRFRDAFGDVLADAIDG